MRAAQVKTADLVSSATVVSSGIVEIVRKQERDWSYMKPVAD
jgi:intracellular sulfur oxidation DsrE/DsrF family protein